MTRKSGDRPLDELERRFQTLRDQIGARPEAGWPELETALQEVSQAIAALRAAGGSPPAEALEARKRQTPRRQPTPFCARSSAPFRICSPSLTGTSTSS